MDDHDAVLSKLSIALDTGQPVDFRLSVEGAAAPASISGRALSEIVWEKLPSSRNGLDIWGLTVTSDLVLDGISAVKLLSFRECKFDGNVQIRDAVLGPVSFASSVVMGTCDLRGSHINGFAFFRFGFHVHGGLLLREVSVESTLNLEDSCLCVDAPLDEFWKSQVRGESFTFERGKARTLLWRRLRQRPEGGVDLRGAILDEFRDDLSRIESLKDWPEDGSLYIQNFVYKSRSAPDPNVLVAWLKLQPSAQMYNELSAYEIAINAFSELGNRPVRDEIIKAKEWLLYEKERSPIVKLVRGAYCAFSDGGTNLTRGLWATFLTYLLSCILLGFVFFRRNYYPSEPSLRGEICARPSEECAFPTMLDAIEYFQSHPDYPAFNVFGQAVDTFIPGLDFGFSKYWSTFNVEGLVVESIIQVAGLFMFAILATCIAGIVVRRP